jgi:prevent-host-death family protein
MSKVGVFQAKAHLSELLDQVQAGAEITITRNGAPVARLVPARPETGEGRSALIDEIVEFSKRCRVKGRVNLRRLIEEGRD